MPETTGAPGIFMDMKRLAVLPNGSFFFYQQPFSDSQFNIIFEKNGEVNMLTPQIDAHDLLALSSLMPKVKSGSHFVELGSWIGQSTCFIGLFASMLQGRMITVDNFQGNPGSVNHDLGFDVKKLLLINLSKYNLMDTVEIIEGDTCSVSVDADFIFIDANHTYSGVKRDLDHWWPLLKPNGIICGHDFEGPEYDDAHIERDYLFGRHHGVIKAVREKFDGMFTHIPNSRIWWVQKT